MTKALYPIALRVAYDGEGYHGFQRQPDHITIENKLLDAFEAFKMLNKRNLPSVSYTIGGRTDASVSAIEQTISFLSLRKPIPAAINSYLPTNIWVWAAAEVPKGFNARYGAIQRTYAYFCSDQGYDIDLMRISAQKLVGQHNFVNFCKKNPDVKSLTRTIDEITIESHNDLLIFRFSARSWLWEQCRRLVTHLLEVGTKKASSDITAALLSSPQPKRPSPAPPEFLLLEKIVYPDIAFDIDVKSLRCIQEYFQKKYSSFVARAGLLRSIRSYFGKFSSGGDP